VSTGSLEGVTAVLVTAYRDGTERVDQPTVTEIANRVAAAGVPVLTALGNTAEVQQLDDAERRAVLTAAAALDAPATLVAGVCGSMRAMLRDIDVARDLGYHAAMIHEPADPFGDEGGLLRFYEQVAVNASLPLVLYLRSRRLSAPRVAELAALPAVVGVKYARDDLHALAGVLTDDSRDACTWINGLAESAAPAFGALGVTSFTSGIANARPDVALAVHRALTGGDLAGLAALTRSYVGPVEAVRAEHGGRYNVATIKQLLRWQGIEAGGVRPPHSELTQAAIARLTEVLLASHGPHAAG
jgi:dihydrodipicolinate synthase/N-acetylneuraminate lyase